jgi:site-specific recombinase XerD
MDNYRPVWKKLAKYADSQGVEYFDLAFAHDFIEKEYGLGIELLNSPYDNRRACIIYRAVRYLSDYQLHGMIPSKKRRKDYVWSPFLEKPFCAYLEWRKVNVAAKTLNLDEYVMHKFSDYLSHKEIHSLDEIDADCIHGYLKTLQKYTHKVLNYKLTRIRAFLVFSYTNDYCKSSLSELIPRLSYVTPTSIPTTYTKEEIECLLSAVDRANPLGKRDYAILLLAVRLGIRSGDIRNLKFENLLWGRNQIEFVQQKSARNLVLPLLNDVGEIIIDYLKNGRPQTESEFVFVRHVAPYDVFKSGAGLYPIMEKYIRSAGLKGDKPKKVGLLSFRPNQPHSALHRHFRGFDLSIYPDYTPF